MRIPSRLEPLVVDGMIDAVVRQLMSGKEAMVFVVRAHEQVLCAKVYKEANQRSFRQAVDYTEGRKYKNSRQARAMAKGSRFGKVEQEAAWQRAEVDAMFRLSAAGVRVPKPYNFHEGVLLMELVVGADGNAAPRLSEIELSAETARHYHGFLIRQVVLMLCAGMVHADLSEHNILVDEHGPVIIDLPQAVDAAANNNAKRLLERDVANLARYFGQFAPELASSQYGPEIWSHYEQAKLTPDTPLTGRFVRNEKVANVREVIEVIDAAKMEDAARKIRKATRQY